MTSRLTAVLFGLFLASACATADPPFDIDVVAQFDEPWSMVFLPDGRLLVTEKKATCSSLRRMARTLSM